MNILFLCTANIHRSKTAEDFFTPMYPNHVFRSAGLSEKECRRNGSTLCAEEMIDWADKIYYFEKKHRDRFIEYVDGQNLENLNIPDEFVYMQPQLVALLVERCRLHNEHEFKIGDTNVLLSKIELIQVKGGWLDHRVTCQIEIDGEAFEYKGIAIDRQIKEFEQGFMEKFLGWLEEKADKNAVEISWYVEDYLDGLVDGEYRFCNGLRGHEDPISPLTDIEKLKIYRRTTIDELPKTQQELEEFLADQDAWDERVLNNRERAIRRIKVLDEAAYKKLITAIENPPEQTEELIKLFELDGFRDRKGMHHLPCIKDGEGDALQLNKEIVESLPWIVEGAVARVIEGKVLIIEKSQATLGDNIRRKSRPMTPRAEALHKHFLSHPRLKDEGGGVLSIELEANDEANALNMPLNDFQEDSKILFGKGVIRDTEFREEGDKLFYKHYLFHPDLFKN